MITRLDQNWQVKKYITDLNAPNLIPSQKKPQNDTFQKSNREVSFSGNGFNYRERNNVIQLVSFSGLNDPFSSEPIGIQMRVRGVKNNQTNDPTGKGTKELKTDKNGFKKLDGIKSNINRLANDWQEGIKLDLSPITVRHSENQFQTLAIKHPKYGNLGYIPYKIYEKIKTYIGDQKDNKNFRIELSNMVAGNTKSLPTIGLRVNLLYTGDDPAKSEAVKNAFSELLNSTDPEVIDTVLPYQPKTSPEEVLKIILGYEAEKSTESANKMQTAIDNIVREIKNQENNSILLVGHSKPDGDTIGSVLGLKNAINLQYPDKTIDCAIDDKIPGLFRHTLQDIDSELKRPINHDRLTDLDNELKKLKNKHKKTEIIDTEIKILEQEKQEVLQAQSSGKILDLNKKYDLVILMDIATPQRFTGGFKNYIEQAKKVIFIDHHPFDRVKEWEEAKNTNGIDIDKIKKDGLFWVAESVPAVAQMVGALSTKIVPALGDIGSGKVSANDVYRETKQKKKLKDFVAGIVTGISTDTGSFLRTANLKPEHMTMAVEQRPNYKPEGMSKWLMDLTEGLEERIDKKWVRDNIKYDIPDEKIPGYDETAREKMLQYATDGKIIDPKLSLGIVVIPYERMFDVWKRARETEEHQGKAPEINLLDVQNAFKYSEVMNILRSNPLLHSPPKGGEMKWRSEIEKNAINDYQGEYDNDRIAVMIIQDKKKDYLDEKVNMAKSDGLRFSFRSQNGTNHAELLSYLFGGGGHGPAAGGRLDIPGVNLNTKLKVIIKREINGKTNQIDETDPNKVYKVLKEKYEINNRPGLSAEEKARLSPDISFVEVSKSYGYTASEWITEIVKQIREDQTNTKAKPAQVILTQSEHNEPDVVKDQKPTNLPDGVITKHIDVSYSKVYQEPPKTDFLSKLKQVKGVNQNNIFTSVQRIMSLSNYLKYKMVGFKVPEYEMNGQNKGGYQWFERGLENLIKGAKNKDLPKNEYKNTAKEFFGLLSLYDDYWKSKEFTVYLKSLRESPTINEDQLYAVNQTLIAVKEIRQESAQKIGFGAGEDKKWVTMKEEFFSPLKAIPEVYQHCAYTSNRLSRNNAVSEETKVSLEHIVPRSWSDGNPINDDGNYLMVSRRANVERQNKGLIDYLKGN